MGNNNWFLTSHTLDSVHNLLVIDADKQILSATILGCASRVILQSLPMVFICSKDNAAPVVRYAECSGYDIRYADPDSAVSELLEPGDRAIPVATILSTEEDGISPFQTGMVLGKILEYVCAATSHPNLAILIDGLPSLGKVPRIENALTISRKINVQFCMTAEHLNEIAATYPATYIKIIENCKVFK